ncbi:MAG: heavy-metal-associated domain-containing protein [Bacteriovoracaceae bacterium]
MEKRIYFKVEGISCGNCVSKIEKALVDLRPEVSIESQSILMTYDSDEFNTKELKERVEDLGYSVLEMRPQ